MYGRRSLCTSDWFAPSQQQQCEQVSEDRSRQESTRVVSNIQGAIEWIGQEMGRLKTQDQSILQQFASIKKTLDQICEQPSTVEENGGGSQRERGVERMAQRGPRTRNLSDSSATYDSEMSRSQDGATGTVAQDWHGVHRDSSEERRGLQRRETLATFHQHRQRDAAACAVPRQASFAEHDHAHRPRWRKKEHIYESLDEIIDDLKQSSPALDAALKQQSRSRRSKQNSREAVQEKEKNFGMIRPHFHSVDQLPSHYFPALSHTPSPSVPATSAKKSSPSTSEDAFSSLHSADSGYRSTERALPTHPSHKASSTRIQHFPSGLLPPHNVLQSSGAHAVSGVRDGSTGARLQPQPHLHQHPFAHRRQESSPASLQRDMAPLTTVPNLEPVQPVRSDRAISRNYSPKSILKKGEGAKSSGSSSKKSGRPGAKHQKSKSGPISFLATLNKVSGTESVSDFDFHPLNPSSSVQQMYPQVPQSTPNMDRPQSPLHSLSQPLAETNGSNCESYIGLIGPDYHQQLVRPMAAPAQRLKGQQTKSHVADARRKEGVMAQKGRDTSGSQNEGTEEAYVQKFSLSQPASSDGYDDDTLVLYKGISHSYEDDDTLVLHNRKLAKRREAALKESQALVKKGNAVEESQTSSRRDKGLKDSHGVSRRDSGARDSHGISRRDSGARDSHGISRRDSGAKDSHGISRRDSGARDSHGISRKDSGARDPHGISRRDSGARDSHGISRKDSGAKDYSATQRSQHHSQPRQEHHYGSAIRNHMVSRSDSRQQPKTFANRPPHPIMEETWC